MDLTDVFRRYESDIYTYFLRLIGDRQEAEELAQETFFRACTAALRFRGDSSIRTWLLGIARRVWLEYMRRPSTAPLSDSTPGSHEPDGALRIDILRTLRALEDTDRECLVLVDVLGFPPREAAHLLEVSPETFRVRLHRARTRFRERLGT